MNSKNFNVGNNFHGLRKNLIPTMLLLALLGCMPDNDKKAADDSSSNGIELSEGKNINKSFKELEDSYDSLEKRLTESQKEVDQLLKKLRQEDSVSVAEKKKKVSEMRFPVFKDPQTKKVTPKEYVVEGDTIPLQDLVENLQKQSAQGNKFLLEGSPEHILFKDSLFLYNSFDEKNSIGEKVITNMSKNKFNQEKSPLTQKEEDNLYDRFLDYVESKVKGENTKRNSDVWNNVIKKEKRGNTTIYYTDLDKKYPGVLASHPSIQPRDYLYFWTAINPYHTSEYYGLSYNKPKQKVITLSKDIFSTYGIYDPKDISYILETINTGGKLSLENLSTLRNPKNTNEEPELYYTQYYKIPKNGCNLLQIQDYGNFDGDSINVNANDYKLTKEFINVDLNNIIGSKVVIQILNEGTMPPNTLMVNLGSYEKKIEGKAGEIIVLDFEE